MVKRLQSANEQNPPLAFFNFFGGLGWVNVKQETLQIFRCTSDKIEAGIECFQKVAKDSQPTTFIYLFARKVRVISHKSELCSH